MSGTQFEDFRIAEWLPFGFALDDAIVVVATLAVLAVFAAMWQVLRPSTSFERRVDQIVQG